MKKLDQLQISWSMTRQQDMNEDEAHRCGLAQLAEPPSLSKRGGGRFSLCLLRVSRTWTRFKSPLPPFAKGGLVESRLTIDSAEIDQGGLTPPKL
jgi:hypothetical protein